MTLSPFEWTVVGTVAAAALGIIGYFLKRTMSTTDSHEKDINEIKRTYVTKDELKEIKNELRDETSKLAEDVKEIKDNYIRKDDFYRTTSDMSRQIDKVHNLLLQIFQEQGGKGNGQQ